MSVDKFAQTIEVMRQRRAVILSDNDESPLLQQEMLAEAFEELSVTLEELHLAQEELSQQNEELVGTQAALEMERQLYQELFEFSPQAYLVTDANGTIRKANRAAAAMLGVCDRLLIGKPLIVFVAESARRSFYNQLSRVCQMEGVREWELRLQPRNGEAFEAALNVTVVRDACGETIALRIGLVDISDRQRAEKKIHFQTRLLEAVEQALIATDLDGTIIYWNRFAEILYGWQSAEAIGRNIVELISAEVSKERAAKIMSGLREGESWSGEFVVRHRDGTRFPAMVTSSPIYDDRGILIGIVGVSSDITDRKSSEAGFRRLFESNIIGIFFAPHSGNISDANDAFLKLVGYSQEDLLSGKVRWDTLTPPEYAYLDERSIEEHKVSGVNNPYEKVYIRQDGKLVHVLIAGASLEDDPDTGITFALDLSDRALAQEALRESEKRFRLMAENSTDIIWAYNPEGICLYVSPAIRTVLGYEPEEIIGHFSAEFIHPDELGAMNENYHTVFKDRDSYALTHRARHKDGHYIWIEATVKIIRNPQTGEIIEIQAFSRDITQRKQAEEEREQILAREVAARGEAEKANRMKDEFLAIVSAELRTPMNPILGWAQLLRTRKISETAMNRALETIERNAKIQLNIINDLLDVSLLIWGKISLNVSNIDLVPAINAEIETLRALAETKSIRVEFAIAPESGCAETSNGALETISEHSPFLVAGDPQRLQQVVWHLLSNAIKFTPKGGRVEVRLSVEMDNSNEELPITQYAQIQVIDTGKGITPDFLPYVFDRFRQADSTTTRTHGGLGLGLAIVRSLVELHGGCVCATSQGEGEGATFTVKLPLQ